MCSKVELVMYMLIFSFVSALMFKCFILVFIGNAKCAHLLLRKVTCLKFLIERTEVSPAQVEPMHPYVLIFTYGKLFHTLSHLVSHSIRICSAPVLLNCSLVIRISEFHAFTLVYFSSFLHKHVFPMSASTVQVHVCLKDKHVYVSSTILCPGQRQYGLSNIAVHSVTFPNENRMNCFEFYHNEYE